jgi:hypothetical protein
MAQRVRFSRRSLVAGLPILAVATIGFAACEQANAAAISPSEAQALAKQAYIYAYAPVYMERQRRNMVSVDADRGDASPTIGGEDRGEPALDGLVSH